jgi:hypothetical protein
MFLRNPAVFEQVKQLHCDMVSFLAQAPSIPDTVWLEGREYSLEKHSWAAYRAADSEEIKRAWIRQISSAGWLAELLLEMRWSILITDTPRFITCDHPVIAIHPQLEFHGFRNPETTVLLPLSPTRILVMDNRHTEPANQYYPLKGSAGATNLLLWRGATEHMFCSRNPDEILLEICGNAEQLAA